MGWKTWLVTDMSDRTTTAGVWGGGHMMESDPGVGADPDFEKKNAGSSAIPGSTAVGA
jgi:hypothetical protein